jgi:hypothetical protein
MSNARDRAAALRKRDAPEPEPEKPVTPPPAPPKKVRQTFDLPGARHQELAAWKLETALALGRSQLSVQDILSAMVDVLLTDDIVARRVRARLEAQADQ